MILRGSMAALPTPSTADGFDEAAFRLVPCGTTGEGSTLAEAERDRITRLCVERAGGALVVTPP